MKKLCLSFLVILACYLFSAKVSAQQGYNPEFLGNACGPDKSGFSPKIFFDYYNQNKISAHDVEFAFEPQYWLNGLTGEERGDDYFQFLAHLPIGYRTEKPANNRNSVFGIGSLYANVEYFLRLVDEIDRTFWLDNGLSVGFPTSTNRDGVRLGGNSYSLTYFQENFIKLNDWIFSISPIGVTWTFKDDKTNITPGLTINIMNSAFGYQITDKIALGLTFIYEIESITGSNDGFGNSLPKTHRFYTGPASSFSLGKNTSLQATIIVDAYTKNIERGQGLSVAFWHMF